MQEVLAKVCQSIDRWNPDESKGTLRGWLYRITSNTSIDELKKRARRPGVAGGSHVQAQMEQLPTSGDDDASLFRTEYRRELLRLAANAVRSEFSDSTWDAFRRISIDGRDAKGIGLNLSSRFVIRHIDCLARRAGREGQEGAQPATGIQDVSQSLARSSAAGSRQRLNRSCTSARILELERAGCALASQGAFLDFCASISPGGHMFDFRLPGREPTAKEY